MNEAPDPQTDAPEEERERWEVLTELEDWLERPMLVLSFVWLCLVIVELVWTTSGVSPSVREVVAWSEARSVC